jgi:tRNA A-37 threonylcarbamoyl transferase component Bud32
VSTGAGADGLIEALVDAPAAAEPGATAGAGPEPDTSAGAERYQFETSIGRTEISQLSRALDKILDRSVIIERHVEGAMDEPTEQRLLGLARGGSPYVQWALAYDRATGVTVFEAPRGVPLADTFDDARLDARAAVRLLRCLARAVAPMHERGATHGAIAATTVVLDEQRNPTLLICGLGRAPAEPPHPREDVRAILDLALRGAGASTPEQGAIAEQTAILVDTIAPDLTGPARAAVLASEPHNGEELYEFSQRLELAILRSRQIAHRSA